MFEKKKTRPV